VEEGINGIKCHKIIDGGKDSIGNDNVVAGEGTGIVHIAPGCGDIDHKIGKKIGLVDIAPLNEE
jgi:isoleucyl-tRNA synthetase